MKTQHPNIHQYHKNKTNNPISSNSPPLATANKTKHSLKIGEGGTKPTGTYNFDN